MSTVCPITQEVPKDPVRTCAGIIYERSAIVEWLSHSWKDPVTGLYLPNKSLVSVNPKDTRTPLEFRKDAVWAQGPFRCIVDETERKFTVEQRADPLYSRARLRHLITEPNFFYMPNMTSEELDATLKITRPTGTGQHLQCLDWSGCPLSHREVEQPLYIKGADFRGTIMPAICFNVTFARCNMSHTDLRNTIFTNCVFMGEQTIFVGAQVGPGTRFTNCKVEDFRTWQTMPDAEFKEGLRARGLDF